MNLPIALTMGEPGGIGPDITLMAFAARVENHLPPFYVIADPAMLAQRASPLGLSVPIAVTTPEMAGELFGEALPVVDPGVTLAGRAGEALGANAAAVIASIDLAVAQVHAGQAAAVVTNPIQKSSLYAAGFRHPGHTEYLGALADARWGGAARPVMMIAGPELRTVPITVHVPHAAVPALLTRELVVETARIVAHDMRRRFGLARPRLVIAGLNPHAGEDGTIGTEDRDVLAPAVRQLVAEGIDARGPVSADTLFHPAARARYDVALCPTHDQALIPAKTLAFDEGVNVTLGLPFVRTSPDHGTALDIAGTGKANPASLMHALRLAARMATGHGG